MNIITAIITGILLSGSGLDEKITSGMIYLFLLLLMIPRIIMAVLCSRLAQHKGYTGYVGTGFFLGLLGLVYVIALPDLYKRKYIRRASMKMQIMDRQIDDLEG